MPTLSDIRTVIRTDVLRDTGAVAKWGDAQLLRFINDAFRRLYPHVFVLTTDTSTTISRTVGIVTYVNTQYTLPAGIPTYPQYDPIYRVEVGPWGGIRISDSLQSTDRYTTLASHTPTDPSWWVDWGARLLHLRAQPPFDTGLVYDYKLKIHYIKPLTALVADADSMTAPDGVMPFIEAWCEYSAYRSLGRQAVSSNDRTANLGALRKEADSQLQMARRECRMTRPTVIR